MNGTIAGDMLFDLVFCFSSWITAGGLLLLAAAVFAVLAQRFTPPAPANAPAGPPAQPAHERMYWWAGTLAAFGGLAVVVALIVSFFGAVHRRGLLTPPASSPGVGVSQQLPSWELPAVSASSLNTKEGKPYQLHPGTNKIVFTGEEEGIFWIQSPKLHYQVKLEAGPHQSLLHQGNGRAPITLNWDDRAQDAPWTQKKIGLDFGGKPAEVVITI